MEQSFKDSIPLAVLGDNIITMPGRRTFCVHTLQVQTRLPAQGFTESLS